MPAALRSVVLPDEPLETARAFLSRISGPGPLLVAVSGGGDSMALLLALHEAAENQRPILAATVDHGLRANSTEEARWVASVCARYGIGHRILSWRGEKPSTGIQSSARLARYRLLKEEASRVGAVGIAAAHTLNDQAETVTMRAARIDGDAFSRGLAGMAEATLFERSAWILRPFLGIRRSRLRQWLVERGQRWLDDPSNEDPRFERVRMRAGGGGAFDAATIRAAQSMRRQQCDVAAALIAERVTVHGGSIARVAIDRGLSIGAAERLAIETLVALMGGGAHRPQSDTASRLAAFVRSGELSRMTAGRAVVDRRAQRLYIYREARSLRPVQIPPGSTVTWDRRYRIENRSSSTLTIAPAGAEEITRARNLAAFDDVPKSVVGRAMGAQPVLAGRPGQGAAPFVFEALPEGITGTRHFALFDVFLPEFDLKLANQCMETFGQLGYGRPPIDTT